MDQGQGRLAMGGDGERYAANLAACLFICMKWKSLHLVDFTIHV